MYGYSEPLDINIEGLDSILLGKEPFIQIHFGGLCLAVLQPLEPEGCIVSHLKILTNFEVY